MPGVAVCMCVQVCIGAAGGECITGGKLQYKSNGAKLILEQKGSCRGRKQDNHGAYLKPLERSFYCTAHLHLKLNHGSQNQKGPPSPALPHTH